MWLAYRMGVPIRIAHSHTAIAEASRPVRKSYEWLMRNLILHYATHSVGISPIAAERLFGSRPDKPVEILYYGLDFTQFKNPSHSDAVRKQFDIPGSRKVIGHVGRFAPVKNHALMVDMFERLIAEGHDAHLLLVGDGPLLPRIQTTIVSRGLGARCTFAGLQTHVEPFFSTMDVFVLPSLYEGLGIVALEAQAAGVPVIASTSVPDEINVVPRLVTRVPTTATPAEWAAAVAETLNRDLVRTGDEMLAFENSRFSLENCIRGLCRIYSAADVGRG
jgi:glycosyltransferase involved in cell wall biosynthesis